MIFYRKHAFIPLVDACYEGVSVKRTLKIVLAIVASVGFIASFVLMLIPDLKWISFILSPLVGIVYLYFFLGGDIVKSIKDKSLYEKTYNDFFDGFRNENGKVRGINRVLKFVERFLLVASAASGIYLVYAWVTSTAERSNIINGVLFCIITTGLAIHFYEANKLMFTIGRKNKGELISESELKHMKILGRLGRYSHLLAFGGILVYLFSLAMKMPIFLVMAPLVPFWAYFTIYLGYGALYSAMIDYALGIRKEFHYQS
ncbi:MAG: hypothetical protein A3J67_04570 [Parcubacteria group bacterium RIFCSPHIGHO2_02_FULL_48_10b]|nr:MAG: hypothetical protein A3J67_04570 [Parcubacteria group bacterium RIFCSPHIGHO2_02_FULL_48_10b]